MINKQLLFLYLFSFTFCVTQSVQGQLDLTHGGIGHYEVYDCVEGAYNWNDSKLFFTSQILAGQEVYNLEGYFNWMRNDGGAYGTELFRGTYNLQANEIVLDGYALVNSYKISLYHYETTVSPNGYDLVDGYFGSYPWSARYVPEPMSVLLLATGIMFIRRRRAKI